MEDWEDWVLVGLALLRTQYDIIIFPFFLGGAGFRAFGWAKREGWDISAGIIGTSDRALLGLRMFYSSTSFSPLLPILGIDWLLVTGSYFYFYFLFCSFLLYFYLHFFFRLGKGQDGKSLGMGRNDTGRYIRSRGFLWGISLGCWESRAGLCRSIAVYHINIAVISWCH